MFTYPTPPDVRRARGQIGNLTPLAIPAKGMNARDAFAVMGPEFAISLENVIVEPYGIRTRKGYTEWATNLPGAMAVSTMMNYYPATAAPAALTKMPFPRSNLKRLMVEPRADPVPPAGKLFAATNGRLYDVTAGGVGPWVPQAGVSGATDFWTWLNFQNVAGSFLVLANNGGGYSYYNGAAWATPVQGAGVGQIEGVDPALFCYVTSFKKRLWFIEKNSTRAWYLPVSQITGLAKQFNFGEQFRHGGHLAELVNWSVDGGEGIDDYLVAISSQGDVVIYKGIDPDDPTQFALHGVWYVGALPVGRRAVLNTGGDVQILSHYGITPLSLLLSIKDSTALEMRRTTFNISPLIARLMRDFASLPGWRIAMVPKEELLVVRVPNDALDFAGEFFVLKLLTGAWSVMKDVPYTDLVTVDSAVFAGTRDSRVVRAFDGPLDNVRLASTTTLGVPIQCQVTPSYQAMGAPGFQKVFKLLRPTFITTTTPSLKIQVLTDYGPARLTVVPTLPLIEHSLWDEAKWNLAKWSGLQAPIKEWIGCHGVGFVATPQLDYLCGGDTLLASIDFWTEQGGVL